MNTFQVKNQLPRSSITPDTEPAYLAGFCFGGTNALRDNIFEPGTFTYEGNLHETT